MKRITKLSAPLTVILLSMAILTVGCQKENNTATVTGTEKATSLLEINDTLNCYCIVDPSPTVSDDEIEMLKYMREEEKLARDVYLAMHELYPLPVFRNIAKSEQHHMNQVLCLLQHYNIPDPASSDTGVFNNSELQELYDSLIEQGSVALVNALQVGATIEDKDIFDLETDIANTLNPAIINTFSKLSCASGNHIRSFSAWLTNKGISYVPQFIDQEEYDMIISLPHQYCGGQ